MAERDKKKFEISNEPSNTDTFKKPSVPAYHKVQRNTLQQHERTSAINQCNTLKQVKADTSSNSSEEHVSDQPITNNSSEGKPRPTLQSLISPIRPRPPLVIPGARIPRSTMNDLSVNTAHGKMKVYVLARDKKTNSIKSYSEDDAEAPDDVKRFSSTNLLMPVPEGQRAPRFTYSNVKDPVKNCIVGIKAVNQQSQEVLHIYRHPQLVYNQGPPYIQPQRNFTPPPPAPPPPPPPVRPPIPVRPSPYVNWQMTNNAMYSNIMEPQFFKSEGQRFRVRWQDLIGIPLIDLRENICYNDQYVWVQEENNEGEENVIDDDKEGFVAGAVKKENVTRNRKRFLKELNQYLNNRTDLENFGHETNQGPYVDGTECASTANNPFINQRQGEEYIPPVEEFRRLSLGRGLSHQQRCGTRRRSSWGAIHHNRNGDNYMQNYSRRQSIDCLNTKPVTTERRRSYGGEQYLGKSISESQLNANAPEFVPMCKRKSIDELKTKISVDKVDSKTVSGEVKN